jgi:hypothetical protein
MKRVTDKTAEGDGMIEEYSHRFFLKYFAGD